MDLVILHDKALILNFLKKNPGLYLYLIGDLDDFFWPSTIWFALRNESGIHSIALLYTGMSTPTLLSFCEKETETTYQLLKRIKSILPIKFNAHLSSGLIPVFGKQNIIEAYGHSYKMVLKKIVEDTNDKNIRKLTTDDLPVIKNFYEEAYPNNWFDGRMLETTKYVGYFLQNRLVGVSGVHVYSNEYRVAALGNIATHPDFRGQQIGYKVTAALCHDLQKHVDVIGLNVKSANEHAIRCYEKIGFEIVGAYDECFIKNDGII